MASIIKADNIQKVSDGSNIIKKCGSTITLGSCGATIALACGATQTGFGQTYSAVEYCTTAKTSPFTAAAGTGYFINTTCGAVTVTLPASPTAGDVVAFKDYASQWNTNAVTLCNNGNKINGSCGTTNLNTQNQSVTLIYVDATKGWQDIQDSTAGIIGTAYITATGGTITTCGDYKIHTFTSDGTFCVSAGAGPFAVVDYLVVAGGGAGAWNGYSGGGGAGGFRESHVAGTSGCYTASPLASCTSLPVTTTTYPITVGGGGANPTPNAYGSNGSNSVFSTITSAGGGYGGIFGGAPTIPGAPGGSGGGGGSSSNPPYPSVGPGGTGNTPPVAPPQGNNGGTGWHDGAVAALGGGGGGATAVGGNGTVPGNAGAGGNGAGTGINPAAGTPGPSPTLRYFAGGGGGGCHCTAPAFRGGPVPGGVGGGGAGCSGAGPLGTSGTANTGGGGGGGPISPTAGTTGGSGIVIIRYRYQ